MRAFESGATRDDCDDKYDFEGFLAPQCVEAYGKYMHIHRKQADGNLRDSDNWQKGMTRSVYLKSLWRHFLDLWFLHRGHRRFDGHGDGHELFAEEVCCAILFNVNGYLFETLIEESEGMREVRRNLDTAIRYSGVDGCDEDAPNIGGSR